MADQKYSNTTTSASVTALDYLLSPIQKTIDESVGER
jgi:hypothetical protein